MMNMRRPAYDAVVFDLLTALLDSWTLWKEVAGSDGDGLRWRRKYLELTYDCGAYRPYEDIILDAARGAEIPQATAERLIDRWGDLRPWPEVGNVLSTLSERVPLGIATNSSDSLAALAVPAAIGPFAVVATAERAGHYKPRPEPYQLVLEKLGTAPERTLFVAGSAADVPGASGVGMPVYWHNRAGLKLVRNGARPIVISDSLKPLLELV